MKRINFNIKDRKVLTLGLCLVAVCVFTLTIAYAALNAVLTIQGSAQVSSADWDVHLANPKVTNGSVTTTVPTLTTGKSLTFSTTLNMPGDFYEFTVDVVNSGSIDAMIEKVTKTPELTADQAKFLKYEVSYANGESVANKQAIAAGVTMPIKVRVEYRKDLSSTDLPTGQVQLTLGLVLDYIQSDGTGSSVTDNGVYVSPVNVVSGDYDTVGSEICIKDECFYVISSTTDTVTMLAKYNLHVGNSLTWDGVNDPVITSLASPTGIQDSSARGAEINAEEMPINLPWVGMTVFSSDSQKGAKYSDYSGSIVEKYVNSYNSYLITQGVTPIEARLITIDELESLGCSGSSHSCSGASSWVYATSYWTGSSTVSGDVFSVVSIGNFGHFNYGRDDSFGVRPVIVISKDYFN